VASDGHQQDIWDSRGFKNLPAELLPFSHSSDFSPSPLSMTSWQNELKVE
jgi:hypothetical protein